MKILIIRTLQSDLLIRLLKQWQAKFGECQFYILTHAGQENLRLIADKFERIYEYNAKGDFSWFWLKSDLRREIRQQGFDLLIVPKKMDRLNGFENVLFMASVLGVKKWFHCGIKGDLLPIGRWRLLPILFGKVLTALLAPIVFGIFIVCALVNLVINKQK